MPGEVWPHGGEEWQKYILLLLKRRYGPEFVEIPDEDRGDYGLEGFSRDGCTYQCYAAENPLSAKELRERQRNKITRDIKKFIDNKNGLLEILGPTKISHWILVVPYWESKELLKHAENKAKKVRELNLPHIADDFFINIEVENYFAVEREQIRGVGLEKLRIDPDNTPQSKCYDFIDDHNELVENLERKIELLSPQSSLENKKKLKINFISHYINGQNLLDKLNSKHPEFYYKTQRTKNDRETFLETTSMISSCKPADLFNKTMDEYKGELSENLKGLESNTINILVYEAMVDWLLRCPLNFPDYEVYI
jgi:hypothetical protein